MKIVKFPKISISDRERAAYNGIIFDSYDKDYDYYLNYGDKFTLCNFNDLSEIAKNCKHKRDIEKINDYLEIVNA